MDKMDKDDIRKLIGKRILEARQSYNRKGMTQEDLANLLDISPVTVSRWETGARQPSFKDIETIANYLNKSISFFFEPNPKESDFDSTFLRMTKELDEETKQDIIDYVRYRYEKWLNQKMRKEE